MRVAKFAHIKTLAIYVMVLFFNAAISFAVFSSLTHWLSPADMGVISLYNSFCILLVPFIGCGIPFSLSVDYFKLDQRGLASKFVNGFVILGINTILVSCLVFLFFHQLRAFLGASAFFVLIAPFTCFLIVVFDNIAMVQIRNRSNHRLFAWVSISKTLMETMLTLLLVAGLSYNWQGRLGSSLISLLAGTLFIVLLFRSWHLWEGRIDLSKMGRMTKEGLPYIPERLAIFILSQSDKFFINHFHTPAIVGLYGAGAQIGWIVNIITTALSNSFQPDIFKNLSSTPVNYAGVRKMITTYIGVSLVISISLVLAIPLVFKILIGEQFQEGQVFARYLAIAGFFWAVYNAFVSCLLFFKKSRIIMIIAIAGSLLSIFLNLLAIPRFGPVGATYVSIIVYLAMACTVIVMVHRQLDLRKIFFSGRSTD